MEFGFFAGLCFIVVILFKSFLKDFPNLTSKDKGKTTEEDDNDQHPA